MAPCACKGSLRYVHRDCLLSWAKERVSLTCELCLSQYSPELLPELKRVVDAAAQQQLVNAQLPPAALTPTGSSSRREDAAPGPPSTRANFWIRFMMVAALVAVIIYLLVFLGSRSTDEKWATVVSQMGEEGRVPRSGWRVVMARSGWRGFSDRLQISRQTPD